MPVALISNSSSFINSWPTVEVVAINVIILPTKMQDLGQHYMPNPIWFYYSVQHHTTGQNYWCILCRSGMTKYLKPHFVGLSFMYCRNCARALHLTMRLSTASCCSGWYSSEHFLFMWRWRGVTARKKSSYSFKLVPGHQFVQTQYELSISCW